MLEKGGKLAFEWVVNDYNKSAVIFTFDTKKLQTRCEYLLKKEKSRATIRLKPEGIVRFDQLNNLAIRCMIESYCLRLVYF